VVELVVLVVVAGFEGFLVPSFYDFLKFTLHIA
jgi:hypothetical protein